MFILIAGFFFPWTIAWIPYLPTGLWISFPFQDGSLSEHFWLSFWHMYPIPKGFNLILPCEHSFPLSPFFPILTVASATGITYTLHLLQTSPKHTESDVRKKSYEFWLIANYLKAIPNSCALPLREHRAARGRATSHLCQVGRNGEPKLCSCVVAA